MTQLERDPWKNEAARLLVNNTTGDIEADEVLALLDDLADSVDFLPAAVASIRSFSIQNQGALVDPGTTISGSQTFLYQVTNPTDVVGNLTLAQEAANLATTLPPDETQFSIAVNSFTLNAGETQTFTLSGTRTGSIAFSRDFVITARQDQDYVYYFTDLDGNFNDFNINTATRAPFANPQMFVPTTWTGLQHLAFAQRATDAAVRQILIGSVDQFAGFTLDAGALTIGGVSYDVYYSTNQLDGTVMDGVQITVVR